MYSRALCTGRIIHYGIWRGREGDDEHDDTGGKIIIVPGSLLPKSPARLLCVSLDGGGGRRVNARGRGAVSCRARASAPTPPSPVATPPLARPRPAFPTRPTRPTTGSVHPAPPRTKEALRAEMKRDDDYDERRQRRRRRLIYFANKTGLPRGAVLNFQYHY